MSVSFHKIHTIEKYKIKWLYLIMTAFIILNSYLISKNTYWAIAIPVVLALILLFVFAFDVVILLVAAATPLSVVLRDMDIRVSLSIPSEILLIGLLLFFIVKLFYDSEIDFSFFRHPLSILIIIHLAWMFLTCITSELPLVSFKYLLSQMWFIIPMYFMGILYFKHDKNIRRFLRAYIASLLIVIVYTTIRHAKVGFDEEIGHWVMYPFYNDHTAYGAITSLLIPVSISLSFDKSHGRFWQWFAIISTILLSIGLYLSFSRAAWIGFLGGAIVFILVLLKIPFRWILTTLVIVIGVFFAFQQQIIDRLEKNKQESSANFLEHVKSISNIRTDASNLERINRWQAAIRLFKERPIVGWGPGTYQFTYAPYQLSKEKTIISTNAGDKGSSHSEYIGPLAERGLPGTLIIILLFSFSIYYGFRVYYKATSRHHRQLAIGLIIGLITYYIHGFMNNFLDTDKLSVPFWAFYAMIVALDLYYTRSKKLSLPNASSDTQDLKSPL